MSNIVRLLIEDFNIHIIILALYLLSFIFISVKSSVNKNEAVLRRLKSTRNIVLLEYILSIIICLLSIGIIYFFNKNINKEVFLFTCIFLVILSTQSGVAIITDGIGHEIDRFLSRAGYVSTILLSVLYLYYLVPEGYTTWKIITLVLLQLITIVIMLFSNSMGPADFRILLLTNPIAISLAYKHTLIFILVEILSASIYQFIIQKKAGDRRLPVPIGHILLLSSLIYLTYISIFK